MELRRTPDGYRLEVSRRVAAPREACWELLTDTERWPAWGPSVRAVESPSRVIEPGTRGRVRVPGGLWVPFRVTDCEAYRWSWRVGRPGGEPRLPATGHRVDPDPAPGGGEGRGRGCLVVFEVPPAAAPYALVCRRALRRIERLAR
jgi:hypothetical protein